MCKSGGLAERAAPRPIRYHDPMTELDDLELGKSASLEPEEGKKRWPWILGGLAVVLLLSAALVLYFLNRPEDVANPPVEASPAEGTPSPPPVSAPAAAEELDEDPSLPALDDSDELVRSRGASLSPSAALARWLLQDGLIRRFAVIVDNVAEGQSPRPHLLFLAPDEPFQATRRSSGHYVDPRSFERYDLVADVFSSLDAQACARLYDFFKPLIDEAYQELGYPRGSFDATLERAVQRLLNTPTLQGNEELIPGVLSYDYADPALEGLAPVEKDFLRMGGRNAAKVKAKLWELLRELDL